MKPSHASFSPHYISRDHHLTVCTISYKYFLILTSGNCDCLYWCKIALEKRCVTLVPTTNAHESHPILDPKNLKFKSFARRKFWFIWHCDMCRIDLLWIYFLSLKFQMIPTMHEVTNISVINSSKFPVKKLQPQPQPRIPLRDATRHRERPHHFHPTLQPQRLSSLARQRTLPGSSRGVGRQLLGQGMQPHCRAVGSRHTRPHLGPRHGRKRHTGLTGHLGHVLLGRGGFDAAGGH